MRFSERRHTTHTEASARQYLARFEDSPHYFWAIVAREAALGHIGNISAAVDPMNSIADISILVGERHVWGRGFGGEAWEAVMAFLHGDLAIRKVTGGTLATNIGMLQIMRRARMAEDGEFQSDRMITDSGVVPPPVAPITLTVVKQALHTIGVRSITMACRLALVVMITRTLSTAD